MAYIEADFSYHIPADFTPSVEDGSYLKIYVETLAGIMKWHQSEELRRRTETANRD
ncbi:MAG: hypothetical protein H7829_12450 [Magnetococcus sp. THC-1_WYH]